MGYRSQVACSISVDRTRTEGEDGKVRWVYDKDKFKEMIGFIKLSRFYELWSRDSDKDSIGWRDGKFVMYGEGWKWYPDYEDVRAFHDMFNAMSDIEGISGHFLRVGEESGDVDEDSFGDEPDWDLFHSFSAISFDGQDYLGKRTTDDEEPQAQDATNPQS